MTSSSRPSTKRNGAWPPGDRPPTARTALAVTAVSATGTPAISANAAAVSARRSSSIRSAWRSSRICDRSTRPRSLPKPSADTSRRREGSSPTSHPAAGPPNRSWQKRTAALTASSGLPARTISVAIPARSLALSSPADSLEVAARLRNTMAIWLATASIVPHRSVAAASGAVTSRTPTSSPREIRGIVSRRRPSGSGPRAGRRDSRTRWRSATRSGSSATSIRGRAGASWPSDRVRKIRTPASSSATAARTQRTAATTASRASADEPNAREMAWRTSSSEGGEERRSGRSLSLARWVTVASLGDRMGLLIPFDSLVRSFRVSVPLPIRLRPEPRSPEREGCMVPHFGRNDHGAWPDGLRRGRAAGVCSVRSFAPFPGRAPRVMLRAIAGSSLDAARLREALGEVLRDARRRLGLTIREAAARSGTRFRPSAIGGYERGERAISLERFCDMAALYGIPPDRLLADVLDRLRPEGRAEVMIDLTRLELLPGEEPRRAAELVQQVRRQRGSEGGDLISLRAGDLEALAMTFRLPPGDLLRRLEPAIQLREPASPANHQ